MRALNYNIHDLLRIRVENPSRALARDMNVRMAHFLAEEPRGDRPDIRVRIGAQDQASGGEWYSLDHKYFVQRDRISFRDEDKGLAWQVGITGLESGVLDVGFRHESANKRRFPWVLFPDAILHLYVLQPLMELLFARRGYMLLHAGAVCKDGRAVLVAGRGGAFKTSLVMECLKRGYELMSDDFVLMKDGDVLAFPTNSALMSYSVAAGKENLSLLDQACFLLSRGRRALPVTPSAKAAKAVVVMPCRCDKVSGEPLNAGDFARMMALNARLEKRAYVSFNYVIGDFLDAYRMVFPESDVSNDVMLQTGGIQDVRLIRIPEHAGRADFTAAADAIIA